jgi:WD40 repeat protein
VVRPEADAVTSENPWPGLAAFTEADAPFFFGRERVCEQLTALVARERLVVLHGRSGLGKTSLLQAGCFPRLREASFLPVRVRFTFPDRVADGAGTAPGFSLTSQVRQAIEHAVAEARAEGPSLPTSATLWEWFHRAGAEFWSERSRRLVPVLVFDQFEELFTLGRRDPLCTAATDAFLDELVDLARGSMPASVARQCEARPDDVLSFTTARDVCHLLIALRKDYVADLLRLRRRVPALFEHHLELRGLTVKDAERVVTGPGGHLVEEGLAPRIVEFVAGARRTAQDEISDTMVDPAILSVFCRELNLQRPKDGKITADLLSGRQATIIADFYERCVADVAPGVRRLIEEDLLTESGARDSLALEEALRLDGVTPAAVDTLIARRLLRRESASEGGQVRLELTHDVLAEPVLASRGRRRAIEEAQRLRDRADQIVRAEREAEERRREQQQLETVQQLLEQQQENLQLATELAAQRQRDLDTAQKLLEVKNELAARQRADLQTAQQLIEVQQELAIRKQRQTRGLVAGMLVLAALLAMATYLGYEAVVARRETTAALAATNVQQAASTIGAGRADLGLAYLARALRLEPANAAARGLVIDALLHRDWPRQVAVLHHELPVLWAQFNASGSRVVTVSRDRTASVWNSSTGSRVTPPLRHDGPVFLARFTRDDRWLVTVAEDGRARVWDLAQAGGGATPGGLPDPAPRVLDHAGAAVTWAAFDPTGRRLTTGAADGSVRIWTMGGPAGAVTIQAHQQGLTAAQFSPDGALLLTASRDATAAIWNADTGQMLRRLSGHADTIVAVQFTADRRLVATASRDGTARLWEVSTGRELARLPHGGAVWGLQFGAGGSKLVTACDDGFARVWDVPGGVPAGEPLRHDGPVTAAVFDASGERVLTASVDGTARIWSRGASRLLFEPLRHDQAVESAQFSPNGELVLTASDDGTARLWDVRAGRSQPAVVRLGAPVLASRFVAGGREIVLATEAGRLAAIAFPDGRLREIRQLPASLVNAQVAASVPLVATILADRVEIADWTSVDAPPRALPSDDRVDVVRFSPDAATLLTGSRGGSVRLWRTATAEATGAKPIEHAAGIWDADFSPDGARVATASADRTARVWDARSGQPVGEPLPHGDDVTMVRFDANGSRVVTASRDGTARLWAVDGSGPSLVLRHRGPVVSARFSPDGRMVATSSEDRTARLWDAPTGRLIATLAHESAVDATAFSQDGSRLATGCRDGDVRVWDVATGQLTTAGATHAGPVYALEFDPGGSVLSSASADGTLRLQDVPLGTAADALALADLAEATGGFQVNESGAAVSIDSVKAIRRLLEGGSHADAAPDTLAARVTRWMLADRAGRPVSPFSTLAGSRDAQREPAPAASRRPTP